MTPTWDRAIMGAGYLFVLGVVAHLIVTTQRYRNLVGVIGLVIFISFGYLASHRRKRVRALLDLT